MHENLAQQVVAFSICAAVAGTVAPFIVVPGVAFYKLVRVSFFEFLG